VAALSPLAAGAALKLEANKIAESAISAVGRVIWSAEAQVEFFCGFFTGFLGLNHLGQSWRGKKDEDKSAISRSVNSGVASRRLAGFVSCVSCHLFVEVGLLGTFRFPYWF
jgi:hypothetical protein